MNKGAAYNGIAQFIDNLKNKTLITFDINGSLDFQDPSVAGQSDSLSPNIANAGSLMFSKNMFGRIFMSFYNSDLSPAGPVRYWDGKRQITVPVIPLPGVTVADSVTAGAWAAATYPITIFFETANHIFLQGSTTVNWVTAGGKQLSLTNVPIGAANLNIVARWVCVDQPSTAGTHYRFPTMRIADNVSTSATFDSPGVNFLTVGSPMDTLVAGSAIQSAPQNASALAHISPDGPGAAPTAADSANAGSIAVGVHTVWIVFETLFGYITAPSPSTTWSAAGGKKAVISSIPIGPWYVVARRVLFSSAGGADMLFLSTFRIADNTTQSVEIDFTDTNLLQGSNVNYLTKNVSIAPAMGIGQYGGRATLWGMLNNIRGIGLNLNFDGGWNQANGAPLGWTLDGTYGPGGIREVFTAFAGDAWRFTGNGATLNRGMVLNAGLVSLLSTNTPYSVSFRAKADAGILSGNVTVELFSPSLGSLGLVSVNGSVIGSWAEFTGSLTLGLASVPSDLVLRVYSGGTLDQNKRIWVDHITIYPTNAKFEPSLLRISNPFDPETFDGVNGFQYFGKDNGEAITAVVQLRAFLYILKERSMHVTWDDTVNPASLWITRQIDSTIGCGSPRGLASSETLLAWSFRSGAYVFVGNRPTKVSQEIQTTWKTIQWNSSGLTHTLHDPEGKQIFFFVPLGGATVLNALMVDYSEGIGQEDDPGPRKWGLDLYPNPINGSLRYETTALDHPASPNQQALYFASNKIYENIGTNDDGAVIDFFYETAHLKAGDAGQDLFGGVGYYVEGSGTLLVTLIGIDDAIQESLANSTIASGLQLEEFGNIENERVRVRFETSGLNTVATIKSITVFAKPWATQRPH
jgi:hypothetical protein